jgi:hypothetical protein
MDERELGRARASRDELAERIARHVAEDGTLEAAPGLFLLRYSEPIGPVYSVSDPSFCIIVQGSKELLLGDERYRYDPLHYLLISAGLPGVRPVSWTVLTPRLCGQRRDFSLAR